MARRSLSTKSKISSLALCALLVSSQFPVMFTVKLPSTALSYRSHCDAIFCRVVDEAYEQMSSLRAVVEAGQCVPAFGSRADEICNRALDQFSRLAPVVGELNKNEELEMEKLHDKKAEDI